MVHWEKGKDKNMFVLTVGKWTGVLNCCFAPTKLDGIPFHPIPFHLWLEATPPPIYAQLAVWKARLWIIFPSLSLFGLITNGWSLYLMIVRTQVRAVLDVTALKTNRDQSLPVSLKGGGLEFKGRGGGSPVHKASHFNIINTTISLLRL